MYHTRTIRLTLLASVKKKKLSPLWRMIFLCPVFSLFHARCSLSSVVRFSRPVPCFGCLALSPPTIRFLLALSGFRELTLRVFTSAQGASDSQKGLNYRRHLSKRLGSCLSVSSSLLRAEPRGQCLLLLPGLVVLYQSRLHLSVQHWLSLRRIFWIIMVR